MKKRIIIPARYGSTRLPAKLLIEVANKPIIQHTYERALACQFDSVLIATDHKAIELACKKIGAPCVMTSSDHATGTDRLAEAMDKMGYDDEDLIINLQGDEPLLPVANLFKVAENLAYHPGADIATLCEAITDKQDIFNPNFVKVVFDRKQYALYFSRAPIPWARDYFPGEMPEHTFYFRHIGLYGYRGHFLKKYSTLSFSEMEQFEHLEQLRALYHGYKIHVDLAPEKNPPGVDTAASLQEVRQILEA